MGPDRPPDPGQMISTNQHCAVCINMGPCHPLSQSQSCTCQARHSLIKLVNALHLPGFRLVVNAIAPGRPRGCRSLPLTSGNPHSTVLCSSSCHTANLSSTGNTVLSYYLWGPAFWDAIQAGIPIALSCRPAPRPASWAKHLRHLPGVVFKLRFSGCHLSRHCAHTVGAFCQSPIFATRRGTIHKPDSCVWDCLALADSQLVCVNMRIWLMRLSSTVAPWWQQKDMICRLSWLQTIRQSVHWDVKHRASPPCLGWQIRLLAESHHFQRAH